jgi:hypothetical protein
MRMRLVSMSACISPTWLEPLCPPIRALEAVPADVAGTEAALALQREVQVG